MAPGHPDVSISNIACCPVIGQKADRNQHSKVLLDGFPFGALNVSVSDTASLRPVGFAGHSHAIRLEFPASLKLKTSLTAFSRAICCIKAIS